MSDEIEDNKNLLIWNQVEKTDSKYTKKIEAGNMKGKLSLSGHYFFKRATELFGPMGKGWGFEIIEERFDETTPIINKANGEQLEMALTHTIKGVIWYKDEDCKEAGQRYEITSFGHTPYRFRGNTATWTTVDAEAPKKSMTDAIKKGLSQLGIAGDIFLGWHEDVEYMKENKEHFELENASDKVALLDERQKMFVDSMEKILITLSNAASHNELQKIYTLYVKKAQDSQSAEYITRLTEVKDSRKKYLDDQKTALEAANKRKSGKK